MKKMKKIAFSLAEVLLTMLVLGILISFTVPSLTLSYERNSTQAGFATIIKDVNKALFNYSIKNQCKGKLSCTNVFANSNSTELLAPEFSAIKTGTNCWNGKGNLNGFLNLDNLSCFMDGKGRIFAFATDTESISADCSTNYYFDSTFAGKHKLKNSCGLLYADINGQKQPNKFGRDIFMFIITDSSSSYLYPNGGKLLKTVSNKKIEPWSEDNCNSSGGITCAGRIVEEGMKVKYLK